MDVREHHRTQSAPRRVPAPRPERRAASTSPCAARRSPTSCRPTPVRAALWGMVEDGEAHWSGGKPAVPEDLPVNTGRPLSDIVLEDRGRTGTTPIQRRLDPLRRHERSREGSVARERLLRRRALVRRGARGGRERHHVPRRRARPWAGARGCGARTTAALAAAARHAGASSGASSSSFRCPSESPGDVALKHGLRGMDAVQLADGHGPARPSRVRTQPDVRSRRRRASTVGCSRPPSARASPRSAARSTDSGARAAAQPGPRGGRA